MIPRDVKSPTAAIPFHKLLKIVAIVDDSNALTKTLLEQIAADGYEIEIADSPDRDVSEDASVGAYIASVDGWRPGGRAQAGARGARDRVPHAVVGAGRFPPTRGHGRARPDGRGRRLYLPRAADPCILCQAGRRQPADVRKDAAATVLRRADGV